MPVQLQTNDGDDHGDEARIEVVPLIDIMFFLLASFMMVSLSMTQLNRVPINLPEASTGVADSKAPPFQIAIDPKTNEVSKGGMDGLIKSLSEKNKKLAAKSAAAGKS